MNFDCKYVLKKGAPVRTSKIQNSLIRTRNRSLDLSVLCSRLNHWADTAVKIFALFWYIFLKHVYICLYLSISVHIYTYLLISVYICAYLFISQNFILEKKNLIFQKKWILVINMFSKKAYLFAPKKSKIPLSAPGIDPLTFRCTADTLTTSLELLWRSPYCFGTYSSNMFISVYICLYLCICRCMRAFTVHIPNQCVSGPYLSLYGLGGTADVRRRRILADSHGYIRYSQIWADMCR